MYISASLPELTHKKKQFDILCLIYAFLCLFLYFATDVLQDFSFLSMFPVILLFFSNFHTFINTNKHHEKKQTPFGFVTLTLLMFAMSNLYIYTNFSKFNDMAALAVAKYPVAQQETEGILKRHQYKVGSGRNRTTYIDIQLLRPHAPPLKLICNFVDRRHSCPQLEHLDQQAVQIKFYSDQRYFVQPEILLLAVQTSTDQFSINTMFQHYKQQKWTAILYFIFIWALGHGLFLWSSWLDFKYNQKLHGV
jgi:hypothetical protein